MTPSGFRLAETSPRTRAHTGTSSPQHLPSSGQASQPGQLGCIITFNRVFSKSSVDTREREILKTLVPSFQKSSLQFSIFTLTPKVCSQPAGSFSPEHPDFIFSFCRSIRTLSSSCSQARTRVLIFSWVANPVSIVKTPGAPQSICMFMGPK